MDILKFIDNQNQFPYGFWNFNEKRKRLEKTYEEILADKNNVYFIGNVIFNVSSDYLCLP